ncbi:MAG: triose-phosphate isomerase, partial [Chitinivibrionales bacterium]
MSRKNFIAGNWKMNTTKDEAVSLAESVVKECSGIDGVDIAVCPPYISLDAVSEVVKGTNVKLGAQDLHWESMGAYTGKVNAEMLRSVGVEYVIIGHSEQRTYFHETDETVNKKLKAALAGGLSPIVCIGETLDERKGGRTEDVVSAQVKG